MTTSDAEPLAHRSAPPFVGYDGFYAHYFKPLVRYLRTAFPECDVEAVAQETFLRALMHWSETDRRPNGWPWLAATARNLARNQFRHDHLLQSQGLHVFDRAARADDDVYGQVEQGEQLRRLARAMTLLTPLQRQVVTVMVEEGLSGPELATRLGMRPSACRMNLARLRSALAESLVLSGAALGALPGAVAVLVRWVARARRGLGHLGPASAITMATLSAAAIVLGVMTPAPLGVTPEVHAEARVNQVVPGGRQAPLRQTAVASPVRAPQEPGSASRPAPATAPSTRVYLSRTPTRAGRTAEVAVTLETPVGTAYLDVPVDQQGDVVPVCRPAAVC